jgi:hypothetical protein
MLKRFKKFGELEWNEKLLFSEAYFLQLTIGLLLKIVPFIWIPRLFAGKVESRKCKKPRTMNEEPGTLNLIKAAIHHSGPYSPWRNKCLISSLAARRMLNRREIPSQLSLGVEKNTDGKMIAHAWLKADDFEIVEKNGDYKELYLF